MKAPELPKDPTNADLAHGITATHHCLHTLTEKVDTIAVSVKALTDHRDSEEARARGIRKFLAAVLVATVASTAATLAGATFLFFTNAHSHETTHKEIADSAAEGYTAEKAEKDKIEQENRDAALGAAMESLNTKIGAVKHSAEHK